MDSVATQSLQTEEEVVDSYISSDLPSQETNPGNTESSRPCKATPMPIMPSDSIILERVLVKLKLVSEKFFTGTSADGYEQFGKYISSVLRDLDSSRAQRVMEKIISNVLSARSGSEVQVLTADPQTSTRRNLTFKVPETLRNEIPNMIDVSSPETRESVFINDGKKHSQLECSQNNFTDTSSSSSKITDTSEKKLGKRRLNSESGTKKISTPTPLGSLNRAETGIVTRNTEQHCSEPNPSGKRSDKNRSNSPPKNYHEKFNENQTVNNKQNCGSDYKPPMKKKKLILGKDKQHSNQLFKEEVLTLPKASSTPTSQCHVPVGNHNSEIPNLEPIQSTSFTSNQNDNKFSVQSRKKEIISIPSTSQKDMFRIQSEKDLSVENKNKQCTPSGTTQVSQNETNNSQTLRNLSVDNSIDNSNISALTQTNKNCQINSTSGQEVLQSIEDTKNPSSLGSESDDGCNSDSLIIPTRIIYPKRRWSRDEINAIYDNFGAFFFFDEKPQRNLVRQIWEKEAALKNRSLDQVVAYINNITTGKQVIPDKMWAKIVRSQSK